MIIIKQDDPTAPHIADLLDFHLNDLRKVMGDRAFALDASGLSSKSVTFWTMWDSDVLLGFGALKELDITHGEVKSMRVAPEARGTGAGRAIMNHIVVEAQRRGYALLSLETGTGPYHAPAVSLYTKAGFTPCGTFADYSPSPQNQFMQLDLKK